jgi:hypothetical protein
MEFVLNRMALGCEYICKKERKRKEDMLETEHACNTAIVAGEERKSNGVVATIASTGQARTLQQAEAFYVNFR